MKVLVGLVLCLALFAAGNLADSSALAHQPHYFYQYPPGLLLFPYNPRLSDYMLGYPYRRSVRPYRTPLAPAPCFLGSLFE